MLEVRGVTVRFDEVVALDGVDLTIEGGEVVTVLGPSGSGKTTLLRVIAGLEPAAKGAVLRDGTDLSDVPPHRRALGLMFQDHALFPHRDVLGNVAFGLRMQGASRRDADARAAATLELVGLAGWERRTVGQLSGGEQQRVALARAIAPEPELLMLDEPLGSLDRPLRERLADELRDLFDRLDLSVLLVTHDQDEAFALGDRVALMDAGRIEQIGTPVDVWTRPATEVVARFLGWNVSDRLTGGRAAVAPDGLRIDDDGSAAGRVVARTFRRDHFRVRVALDPGSETAGSETVEVAVPADHVPPSIGDEVRLTVDPRRVRPLP